MENTGPFDDQQRAYMSLKAEQQASYDLALSIACDPDSSDRERAKAHAKLDRLHELGKHNIKELDKQIEAGGLFI